MESESTALDVDYAAARASSDRVRVVHLVLGLSIGGLEQVVYDLVRCVDRDQFEVHVLCLGEIGIWGPKFEALGVSVEGLGALDLGTFGRVVKVAKRLRELRPDILHTHNPAPHTVGALAACFSRVPVVINTKHGRNYPHIRKWVLANRLAAWLSSKVVAVSQDAADVALKIERVARHKVEVIRNGIDLTRFPLGRRPRRQLQRRAVHVARISYSSKDQRTLMSAVRIVADKQRDFVLDIVGDGPDRSDLEAFCDALGLRQHVNFIGFRNDVHSFLSRAEFFVLSSVTEGVSITLLEAAATGLPIVATNVGGNPEVTVHGETGLLVPPRSPEALAAAMLDMLQDTNRARRMGIAGRRRVERHFDLRRSVARYEELYLSLLPARREASLAPIDWRVAGVSRLVEANVNE
jgi:glycosyltransferase involved in cell wall biosynthesis